ncbi:hypothetical protein [Streptomyces sp. NPDC001502]|uniref:hypothetical protein n=1 Tax=Streptomyces sp. NPDC001502 TaxID=3364578 RepID=UPI0036CFE4B6
MEAWEAKLAVYGTEYMSLGAADIQRRVSAELVTVQQQLDNPRLWSVAARLMTLYAKTFPGSDGAKAVHWYRMAAQAADAFEDLDTRVWVRGRAAIALGYEGAALPVADVLADQAMALSDRPSLGLLDAVFGKAHAAALRGDHTTARRPPRTRPESHRRRGEVRRGHHGLRARPLRPGRPDIPLPPPRPA